MSRYRALEILVGPTVQQQTHTVSVTCQSGEMKRRISVLRDGAEHINRGQRTKEVIQSSNHEEKAQPNRGEG
jgi:hypothetical protein